RQDRTRHVRADRFDRSRAPCGPHEALPVPRVLAGTGEHRERGGGRHEAHEQYLQHGPAQQPTEQRRADPQEDAPADDHSVPTTSRSSTAMSSSLPSTLTSSTTSIVVPVPATANVNVVAAEPTASGPSPTPSASVSTRKTPLNWFTSPR